MSWGEESDRLCGGNGRLWGLHEKKKKKTVSEAEF